MVFSHLVFVPVVQVDQVAHNLAIYWVDVGAINGALRVAGGFKGLSPHLTDEVTAAQDKHSSSQSRFNLFHDLIT